VDNWSVSVDVLERLAEHAGVSIEVNRNWVTIEGRDKKYPRKKAYQYLYMKARRQRDQ
jgi:hypothetical protein